MNRNSSSELPAAGGHTPGPEANKRHFDTFETQFFKDGEAASATAEADHFEDLDEGKRKRFAPSRRFVVGVVAGSVCLAVIGCLALWRSGGKTDEVAAVETSGTPTPAPAADPAPAVPAPPAPAAASTGATVPAQPEQAVAAAPIPAVAPGPGGQPQAAPSVPVAAAPAAAAAPVAPPSAPAPAPAPAAAAAPAVAAAPVAPAPVPAKSADVAPSPAVGDAAAARARCKEISAGRRQKELLSVCGAAFAADPSAADVAVILAKAEFDKGHAAEALAWSQKALAADPNAADAYVFIGGVEQSAGHKKAAKEAYKRYLQLAPGGRYAGDLRAIVGTL